MRTIAAPSALATLLALFALPLSGPAQQAPRFQLLPRPPEPAAPAGPEWPTSFAAAEAAAKEQHRSLLLYFTAKW